MRCSLGYSKGYSSQGQQSFKGQVLGQSRLKRNRVGVWEIVLGRVWMLGLANLGCLDLLCADLGCLALLWVRCGHWNLLCSGFRMLGAALGQVWTLGPVSCQIWDNGIWSTFEFRTLGSAFCLGPGSVVCVSPTMGTGVIPWAQQSQTQQGSTQRLSISLSAPHNSAWYCSIWKASLGCMKMPSITFQ